MQTEYMLIFYMVDVYKNAVPGMETSPSIEPEVLLPFKHNHSAVFITDPNNSKTNLNNLKTAWSCSFLIKLPSTYP